MRRLPFLVFALVFLTASAAFAATEIGAVTSVGKDAFAIKSSLTNEEMTFKIGDELKQGKTAYGGKPSDLKKGVRVHLRYKVESGSYVCTDFQVIGRPIGRCEIDFSPMLVGDSVPPCSVHVRAGSEKGGIINESFVFSAPTKVPAVRDEIQRMFSKSGRSRRSGRRRSLSYHTRMPFRGA